MNTFPGKQSSPGASSGEYKVNVGSSTTSSAPLAISDDEVIFAHSNKDAAAAKAHGNELNVVFSNTLQTLRNRTNQKQPAGDSSITSFDESCQPPDLETVIIRDAKVMNNNETRIDGLDQKDVFSAESTSQESSSVDEDATAIPCNTIHAEKKDDPITQIEMKSTQEQEKGMITFVTEGFSDVGDIANESLMDEGRRQQQKEQRTGMEDDDLELVSVEEYSSPSTSTPYFSTYQEEDKNPISSTPPSPATIIEMRPEEFAAEASMAMLTFEDHDETLESHHKSVAESLVESPDLIDVFKVDEHWTDDTLANQKVEEKGERTFKGHDETFSSLSSDLDSSGGCSAEEDEPTSSSSLPLSLYNKNTSLSANARRDISSITRESLDNSEHKEVDNTYAVIPTGGGLSNNQPLGLDKGQQIDLVCSSKKETYYKEKLISKSPSPPSKVAKSSEDFHFVQQNENECNNASASPSPSSSLDAEAADDDVDDLPILQEEVKSILPSGSPKKDVEARRGEFGILQDKLEAER